MRYLSFDNPIGWILLFAMTVLTFPLTLILLILGPVTAYVWFGSIMGSWAGMLLYKDYRELKHLKHGSSGLNKEQALEKVVREWREESG